MRIFAGILLFLALQGATVYAQMPPVLPEPVEMMLQKGRFVLNRKTKITIDGNAPALRTLADLFSGWLAPATGFVLPVDNSAGTENTIRLELKNSLPGVTHPEGYQLQVTPRGIHLVALQPAGIFYGMQTLRQLLPDVVNRSVVQPQVWSVPALRVLDYPRFGWRGLMLDVSRHFFSKEFVKQYIDQMARYKFNVFHWHLTDDQGWRIEIKAFPKLTTVGAWRVPRTGQWWTYDQPGKDEPATYGGFYTQDDIREIVEYARQRQITIVPEIDVPGHSLAAIAAYPWLSATGYIYPVNPGSKFYTIQDNTLNPADERVYDFLDKVFTEVAALFPGEYIHIGGDECTKYFWNKSAQVQAFMQKEGIPTEQHLQSYFVRRMEKMLIGKGKKLIGWDEILEGGLAPEATVMSWQGMKGGIEAAKQGHSVVMTPAEKVYLDLYQGDPVLEPDTYSMLRLKTCYDWDPVPEDVKPELILGGQGNLWSESVPTPRHAEYMTWPRSLALAEVYWSPRAKRNWGLFQEKLPSALKQLAAAGINYSTAAWDVLVTAQHNGNKELLASLTTDVDGLSIYYTLDNTNPDEYSQKYGGQPILIPKGIHQLRAITYKGKNPVGKLLVISRNELENRAGN